MNHSHLLSRDMIAGVVVLYNSPPACLDTIKTYLNQVQKLYVIDNSPTVSQWLVDQQTADATIFYEHFAQNVGIATALNKAARYAIADGFAYLLTMDDDSQAPAGMIDTMLAYLNTAQHETIGILSPKHLLVTALHTNRIDTSAEARPIITTMTSGNLLNLSIYQAVGPFCDDLFIDVVDHEYNLRLKVAGYKIIELPTLLLAHRLGHQKKKLGLRFVSHTPIRNYYLVRNSLFVAGKYWHNEPGYMLTALKGALIEIVKAGILEDKPIVRLRLIGKGIVDSLRKNLGKRSQP